MKRTSLALVALGLSVGMLTAASANAATDSLFPRKYSIGITGAILQPTSSGADLAYGFYHTPGALTTLSSSQLRVVNPDYRGAWGINLAYLLPCSSTDIAINYFQFDTHETDKVSLLPGQGFVLENPNFPLPNALEPINAESIAEGKARYHLNQVDVAFGQFVDLKCSAFTLHPTVGIRYARLSRTLSSAGFFNGLTLSNEATIDLVHQVREKSRFNGLGPILGLDADYALGCGFGLIGHVDGALLVGNANTNNSFYSTNLTGGAVSASTWSEETTRRIVPVVDMKFGATYIYKVGCRCPSAFKLEAGWQVSHYFHSVDRTYASTGNSDSALAPGSTFVANVNGISSTSGFGYQGAYANLTYSFG